MAEKIEPYQVARTYATLEDAKADEGLLREILGLGQGRRHQCPAHLGDGKPFTIMRRDNVWTCRCWARGCIAGTAVDALMWRNGLEMHEALALLTGNSSGAKGKKRRRCRRRPDLGSGSATEEPIPPEPRALRLDVVNDVIDEYVGMFPNQLAARGIPLPIAERHRLAFIDEFVFKGRNRSFEVCNSWLIPVTDPWGKVRAVKVHREVPEADGRKCSWAPVGRHRPKSPHGYATLMPPPETYDGDGLPSCLSDWPEQMQERFEAHRDDEEQYYGGILDDFEIEERADELARRDQRLERPVLSERWLHLLPGELKAFAVLGAGLDATAITAGEQHRWTPGLVARLKGRRVCLVWDDDATGRDFRDRTVEALAVACAELRAITFGSRDGRKLDANDLGVELGPWGLRERIKRLRTAAPDLARPPFELASHRQELESVLGGALDPAGLPIWCIQSVVGAGKSTLARSIMLQSGRRYLVLVKDHRLAKEYEAFFRAQGASEEAMRLLSPSQMDKENHFRCPSLRMIEELGKRGIPYTQKVCGACPVRKECPVFQQKDRLEGVRILIGQHAHLRLLDFKRAYWEGRVLVVDESCVLGGLRWRVEFSSKDVKGFVEMLEAFAKAKPGHDAAVGELTDACKRLIELKAGHSSDLQGSIACMDGGLQRDWGDWLAGTALKGRNLMGPLLDALKRHRWVRCTRVGRREERREGAIGLKPKMGKMDILWLVQEPEALRELPVVMLDATAKKEVLRQIFPDRDVRMFPEGDPPPPKSEVIQLIGARNPAMTLWDIDNGKPKRAFWRICRHIEAAVTHYGADWDKVGVITLKRLRPFVQEALPGLAETRLLHYPARGTNDLRDVELLAVVGVQQPPDLEMALDAATLADLDMDPEDLLRGRGTSMKGMRALAGPGYELESFDYGDGRMNAVFDLLVTSELVQSIGRARIYEEREGPQRVLLFTEQPLPMPVTRIVHWREHLREMGGGDGVPDIGARVLGAMEALARNGAGFGYAEIAEQLGVAETTLKKKAEYREEVEFSAVVLGLRFQRARRRRGLFLPAALCKEARS